MKKGQVWIETVIYILIGLTIIGILLALITPKINQMTDKSVIDNMISGLNDLDDKINEAKLAPGSIRTFELGLKKGQLSINPAENKIVFVLDNSEVEYSEIGKAIERGDIVILSEKTNGIVKVSLSLAYNNVKITYIQKNDKKIFSPASIPYYLIIENKGEKTVGDSKIPWIDIYPLS